METSKLRKFAQFARRGLMEQVAARLKVVLAEESAARRESRNAVSELERQIKADGEAQAILAIATATADGLRQVADAVKQDGGNEAMQLRIAQQYLNEFGNLAKEGNTLIIPQNLSDIGGTVASLAKILEGRKGGDP